MAEQTVIVQGLDAVAPIVVCLLGIIIYLLIAILRAVRRG